MGLEARGYRGGGNNRAGNNTAKDSQALDSFMAQFGPKKGPTGLDQLQQRLAAIYTDPSERGPGAPHDRLGQLPQRLAALQRRTGHAGHTDYTVDPDSRLLPDISRGAGSLPAGHYVPGLIEVRPPSCPVALVCMVEIEGIALPSTCGGTD